MRPCMELLLREIDLARVRTVQSSWSAAQLAPRMNCKGNFPAAGEIKCNGPHNYGGTSQ
jgi:hypothetical protein